MIISTTLQNMSQTEEFPHENHQGEELDWMHEEVLEGINDLCATATAFKPTKRLESLIADKKYKMAGLKKVTTRYGTRLVADLEEYEVFLPVRMCKITSLQLEFLNNCNKIYLINNLWEDTQCKIY